LKTASFTAVGLNPKEPRHLVFIHPEKKLGKLLRLRGDEKDPLIVKLEPLGAVSGRILTEEGKPAANRRVSIGPPNLFAFYRDYPIELLNNGQNRRPSRGGIRWLPDPVKTGADGKFHLDGLIPGLKYYLPAAGYRRANIVVESGKTKNLGDLK
jgi:hypothetical protein